MITDCEILSTVDILPDDAFNACEYFEKMKFSLHKISETLPDDLKYLRYEAKKEGYNFVERPFDQWDSERLLFNRENEALICGRMNGAIAGLGGITVDPEIPDALRMRRFYIQPDFRRRGLATAICDALLMSAQGSHKTITVNAGTKDASPFWETRGFAPSSQIGITHIYISH
jgi:GNAT superfamily N-acetyltransferase